MQNLFSVGCCFEFGSKVIDDVDTKSDLANLDVGYKTWLWQHAETWSFITYNVWSDFWYTDVGRTIETTVQRALVRGAAEPHQPTADWRPPFLWRHHRLRRQRRRISGSSLRVDGVERLFLHAVLKQSQWCHHPWWQQSRDHQYVATGRVTWRHRHGMIVLVEV